MDRVWASQKMKFCFLNVERITCNPRASEARGLGLKSWIKGIVCMAEGVKIPVVCLSVTDVLPAV